MTEPTTKLSHSYTSIKMFENCPKRYFHQRIEKSVQDKGGEASLYGERVHKNLEDRLKTGVELPADCATMEPVCRKLEAAAGDAGVLAEQEMTLNEQLEPTGWWDKDAWLRSKIDVLAVRGSTAAMVDWKTGKRRPDFDQLEMFALQVFKHYEDVERVRTTFVWTKTKDTDSKVFTRDDEAPLWQKLLTKITRIEQALEAENWPARPSGLCPWCPCQSFCEYAR